MESGRLAAWVAGVDSAAKAAVVRVKAASRGNVKRRRDRMGKGRRKERRTANEIRHRANFWKYGS
jgi:hypothetical protein